MFDQMWKKFPKGNSDEVKSKIGGKVNADWIENTCAIRVSYALNRTGEEIPFENDETVSGYMSDDENKRDKKWHYFRVAKLDNYLDKNHDNSVSLSKNETVEIKNRLSDKQGIVIFNQHFSDATGHATLFRNGQFPDDPETKHDYSGTAESAKFYSF